MADNSTHINYTQADIERYLQGKMTNAEMYAIEKAALQDPFLADAIEGYELADFEKAKEELSVSSEVIAHFAKPISQNNYNITDFEKYYTGKMSNTEMHLLEKDALKDNFLANAMEGYEQTDFEKAKNYLAQSEKEILGVEKDEAKVVAINSSKNKYWLKIAAAIILMLGAGSTIWWMNNKNNLQEKEIAQVTHAEIKQTPSENSSITTPSLKTETSNSNLGENKRDFPKSFENTQQQNGGNAIATPSDQFSNTEKVKADDEVVIKQESNPILSQPKSTTENKEQNYEKNVATISSGSAKNPVSINNGYISNNLKGRIVNESGEPVLATISILNTDKKLNLITNNEGDFTVKVPDTNVIVNIRSVGYANLTTNLNTNSSNEIVLQKSNENLSEVVVVGYGNSNKRKENSAAEAASSKKISQNATPVGGWQAFYDYVNKKKAEELEKLDSTLEEDVTVEFKVKNDGTPYNISTSNNNNRKITNKAIEIIKEGPKWTNAPNGKKIVVILTF